jgi:hypothetical protein
MHSPGLSAASEPALVVGFGVASGLQRQSEEAPVLDTILLLTTVAFFAVSIAYAAACDHL